MEPFSPPAPRLPSTLDKLGFAAGLVPFVLTISSTSSSTVHGVTSVVHRDYVAILGALFAALAAVVGLCWVGSTPAPLRNRRLAIGLALAGLAALQVARGFGKL